MCITEADLNFDANCIIIEGDNGQGKSAVMEAIAICLSERKRSDSVKEFIQKPHDHAKIILDLIYNDEQILFDVNLNHKGGTPLERDVLYKGKHYINSEVTDLIKELDFTFYSDIIMQMQGQDDIATMTPVMRLNLLQRLFQFDFTEEIGPIQEKLEEFVKNKTLDIDKIDFLEKANKQKDSTLKSLKEKDFDFSKEDYDNYKNELDDKKAQVEKLSNDLDKTFEILQKKTDIQGMIDTIENQQAGIAQKLLDNKKAAEALKKADYPTQISSLGTGETDAMMKKAAAEDIIKNKKNAIAQLETSISSINVQIGELNAAKKNCDHKLELAKKGICPECGKPTDDIDDVKIIKEKEEYDDKIGDEIEKKDNLIIEMNKYKDEVAAQRKQISVLEASISRFDTEAKMLEQQEAAEKAKLIPEEKIKEYEDKLKELDEKAKPLYDLIHDYDDQLSDRNKKTLEKSKLKTEIADLEKKIKGSDEIADHNKVVVLQRMSIKNEILENEKNIEVFRNLISDIDLNVQTYNEVLRVLDKELPNYLVVKTCAKLEAEMNNFVNIVFPNFRLRLLQSRRGVEFFYTTDPNVDMTDIKKLINSKMASGYEKSVLGLAFKVALCKAYNLSFIALDEIDAAASEGNSVLTMESLISSNIFNQIFFITHKEATRDIIKSLSSSVICYHTEKGVFTNDYTD
jgi:chromosome segregation ATPase